MKRLALLLLVVALPLAAARAEKWWEAYNRGVKAVNAKNYEEAVSALQATIAEMPVENNSARARNQVIVYVPHFWLGIAQFNLGDIDGAMREWKISEEQGAIAKTEYYAKLRDWVARGQAEKVREAQNNAAGAKKDADAAVSRALSGQMAALSAGADRSEVYRAGLRKLQEALSQFNSAGNDIRGYNRAAETAGQARDLFAKAAEDAKKQKVVRPVLASKQPQPQPAPQQPPSQPPPAVVATTTVAEPPKKAVEPPPAVAAQPVTPPPPAVETPVESEARVAARVALQQYRRRLASLSTLRATAELQSYIRDAVRDADKLQQRLSDGVDDAIAKEVVEAAATADSELTSRLVALNAQPKTDIRVQLESAYRAFASGNFDSSERILTTVLDLAPSGEAYLLRGCLRYTRAVLSRTPEPLLEAASGDFRSALKLKRSLRLDKKTFSPKLVAFFDEVRGAM